MFKKYYPPPDIKGRNIFIKNLLKERGKKHYWGEPGKNYGFYTNEEEKDIAFHWNQQNHRKGNSYSYINLDTNDNSFQNIKKKTRSSFSQRMNTQPQKNQKLYSDINQKKCLQNQQTYQQRDLYNKWKHYASIQYGGEERKQKDFQLNNLEKRSSRNRLLSKNIDICLPKIQRKSILKPDLAQPLKEQHKEREILQYQRNDQGQLRKNNKKIGQIVQRQLAARSKTLDASILQREQQNLKQEYTNKKINLKELQKRKNGYVFIMEPKLDRSFSPTYCNSINYPLPYFRHIK